MKTPPESGKIALVFASGIAALACPTLLPAAGIAVVQALAPNIASDMLTGIRYDRIRTFFRPTHPDQLNHDLARLLHTSSVQAVKYLEILYTEKIRDQYAGRLAGVGEEWVKQAKKDFALLRKTLQAIPFTEMGLDELLNQADRVTPAQIVDVLPELPNEQVRRFVLDHLSAQLALAFREALKDKDNERAWKAMQLWVIEETRTANHDLLAGQTAIQEKLDNLLLDPAGLQSSLEVALDQQTQLIFQQFDRVLAGQQAIIEEIRKVQEPIVPSSGILTTIPRMEDKLIGREKDLEKLHTVLQSEEGVVCLVNGMGGIGKTRVAMEYIKRYGSNYAFRAWISCTTDLAEAFLLSPLLLRHLAYEPTKDIDQDARNILNALSNLGNGGLLVIDNANKQVESFRDSLPPNWKVLLTSRQDLSFRNLLPLGFLDEEEALALFFTHYRLDDHREAATRLIIALGYHTLTIELLAKTAQKLRIRSLEELIGLFEAKGLKIGRKARVRTGHSPDKEIERLFPYLLHIFDLGDLAADPPRAYLLQLFALFPSLFTAFPDIAQLLGKEEEESLDQLRDELDQLVESGWLIREEGEGVDSFKMHQVIQEVILAKLPVEAADFTGVIQGIRERINYSNIDTSHIFSEKLVWQPWAERILELFSSQEEDELIDLLDRLGYLKEHLGEYQSAALLKEKALSLCGSIRGREDESYSKYQSNLANVYGDLGDYEKARDLLEEALASALRNFGELHPTVAIRQSNLANVYRNLGDYAKARDLLEEALASDLRNFGELHPTVAISQSNLANVYRNLGDYEKARDLLEEALASDLRNFGELHPTVAIRQSNLANVYRNLGDYAKARDLLEEALASALRNFGELHPTVAISQSNLANVYRNLGDYEKARDLLEEALASDLRNFGELHPTVAISRNNLAYVYRYTKAYAKAIQEFQSAMDIIEKAMGKEHPHYSMFGESLLATIKEGVAAGDPEMIQLKEEMGL